MCHQRREGKIDVSTVTVYKTWTMSRTSVGSMCPPTLNFQHLLYSLLPTKQGRMYVIDLFFLAIVLIPWLVDAFKCRGSPPLCIEYIVTQFYLSSSSALSWVIFLYSGSLFIFILAISSHLYSSYRKIRKSFLRTEILVA